MRCRHGSNIRALQIVRAPSQQLRLQPRSLAVVMTAASKLVLTARFMSTILVAGSIGDEGAGGVELLTVWGRNSPVETNCLAMRWAGLPYKQHQRL